MGRLTDRLLMAGAVAIFGLSVTIGFGDFPNSEGQGANGAYWAQIIGLSGYLLVLAFTSRNLAQELLSGER